MKAVTFSKYGPPEVLRLEELPRPEPQSGEVLVRIHATAVNSGDWRLRRADPFLVRLFFGLFKPRIKVLGSVFSGTVEAVGTGVSNYKAGDAVFGLSDKKFGAYAEYLAFPASDSMALKPQTLSHAEAASLVFGGHTALHFLRKAGLAKGQHILIYGASGAVGTSAVQLAKHFGARVTAVCSTDNVGWVRSLGADAVIDYTTTDISSLEGGYDMVYETVNKAPVPQMARLLTSGGVLILGAALLKGMLQGTIASMTSSIRVIGGVAKSSSGDLRFLGELASRGALKPVIDRTYALHEMAAAHAYVEKGHKKGNVVVLVTPGK